MKKLSPQLAIIAVLLVTGIFTRFYIFGSPNQIVFDEIYFTEFVTHYFDGEYYFDIHPPFAKLLMAGAAKISGTEPPLVFKFEKISQEYPNNFYKLLRFVVGLFGIALIIAVYFLAKELSGSQWVGFVAALLVVFDNAFLVQSRYILTDIFLLTFGVLGLWLSLIWRRTHSNKILLLSALFLAMSASVKWTGLLFIGVAGIVLLVESFRKRSWRLFLKSAGLALTVMAIFYFSVFAVHFKILSFTGPGDAFMSQRFQAGLLGNGLYGEPGFEPMTTFEKFTELNKEMMRANSSITAGHPYGSKWYQWPVLKRPIYFWNGKPQNGAEPKIYLQGNPVLWWLAALSIFWWLGWFLFNIFKKKKEKHFFAIGLILSGFMANLLAYAFISRVSFLYHYFPSLIFAIIALAFFMGVYLRKYPAVAGFLAAIILACFLFFAPLSYGTPLSTEEFNMRTWFSSWI